MIIPPPKKYVGKKSYIDKFKVIKELTPDNKYELPVIYNFILTHIPITSIYFTSTNNSGSYRRFIFESHFLNTVLTLILFGTLGLFNTLLFSDNLIVINYSKQGLGAGSYIIYSILSSLINIVLGFLLMLFLNHCQDLKPKKNYEVADFVSGIKNLISSYKCRIFGFVFVGILLTIISMYCLGTFVNFYPNMKKHLIIQIILSFIFENIFYAAILALIWVIMKYLLKK